MKFEDVLKFYGSVKAIAETLGIRTQSIYQWKKTGYVTEKSALRLIMLSSGKIPFDESVYNGFRSHK